ncbi:hypothetical protein ACOSP7_031172 [Xanthoceras sorbifolium]
MRVHNILVSGPSRVHSPHVIHAPHSGSFFVRFVCAPHVPLHTIWGYAAPPPQSSLAPAGCANVVKFASIGPLWRSHAHQEFPSYLLYSSLLITGELCLTTITVCFIGTSFYPIWCLR